jgi:hypothetical protein
MLQQGAQAVPGLQMETIVSLIAVVGYGHRTIGREAKTANELLEIGTLLLTVPPLNWTAFAFCPS